jgi:hypothetical protein
VYMIVCVVYLTVMYILGRITERILIKDKDLDKITTKNTYSAEVFGSKATFCKMNLKNNILIQIRLCRIVLCVPIPWRWLCDKYNLTYTSYTRKEHVWVKVAVVHTVDWYSSLRIFFNWSCRDLGQVD